VEMCGKQADTRAGHEGRETLLVRCTKPAHRQLEVCSIDVEGPDALPASILGNGGARD